MADGTVLTGQPDTAPAEGNQGQGEPNAEPTQGQPQGQPGEGGGDGSPAAEPGKGPQDGAKEGEGEGEGKPKEGEGEGESQAPETYEWTAPEGFEGELDQSAIEAFEPIAKELGLTQEQADKMVALHAESVQRAQQQARDNWAQQTQAWVDELKNDAEFGGQAFEETVTAATKAIEQFGTPGLKEALESTGMGNHPELVRTFAQIGKAIGEDKIHMGGQSHGQRGAIEILYPNEAKK